MRYQPGTLGHVFDSIPPAGLAEKFPAENGPSECKVPNFAGIKKGVFPDFTQTAKGPKMGVSTGWGVPDPKKHRREFSVHLIRNLVDFQVVKVKAETEAEARKKARDTAPPEGWCDGHATRVRVEFCNEL